MVGNSIFNKIDEHKYTGLRMAKGRVVNRALMDYVWLPKRMLGRLRYESMKTRRWRNV